MQYHPDDFLRLVEAVEDTGGTLLPDICNPRQFKLRLPSPETGEYEWTDLYTSGCMREARFALPYNVPQSKQGAKMKERAAGIVTVCAVDDDMGKWPRFQHAIKEDSF